MLKCQFHTHSAGDLLDYIPYSPKDLIKKAAELKYDVLSITCHNKVIFTKDLKRYAEKQNILLIPGIELNIGKKHVLILNANKKIQEAKTYEDLRTYKKIHPNCLIVAPHPFFPGKTSLKKELIDNIDLFDAIEYSFCYTKTKNYNKEAEALAKRWRKPIIVASDCHILKYLDLAHSLIDAPKNTESIISAIKQNKIENISKPTSYFKIGKIVSQIILRNLIKKRHL